jgi:acyl-CoA synthetase (AMP-forming)/AMP-acid ligase II/alkylation response protein AidB-like acyl-CoA dehydrogenase/acyl carrier protein
MFASHHESDLGEQNCLYCQKVSRQYRNVPPSNFVELLGHRSLEQSDKTAVTFLLDGENVTESLTYKELDGRARALAVRLLEEISPGERVLILQPPGVEFVVSFFGCLYAGVVAVATYPPHKQRQVSRIEAIFEDAQPQMVLTSKALLSRINSWLDKRAERLRAIYTEELATAGSDGWQSPVLRPETLALLQYTSGSTGTPRGVMVTHGNIMANEEMIRQTFGQHEESSVVSWLPIYHDMGLIGNLLQPLYLGTSTVLMSPASFLQKPVRWLSAVSRFRARTTGGPNFAFDLCARAVTNEQKAGLDLSCLELLYSGAEPIEASVLDRFAAAFRECGLRREALFACYGLAEATVLATGGGLRTGPNYLQVDTDLLQSGRGVPSDVSNQRSTTLVSCGQSAVGQDLRIVDPASKRILPESEVGEIWLRGPHITTGYWGNDADTREFCRASIADGEEGFLRTGDLGFMHAGELYVTGRIKDVIIIRGQNHYPQDIERTVEACHPAVQPAGCSAFGITEEGEERLVIAVEVQRSALRDLDSEAVAAAIRRNVVDAHEIAVHAVVLLKPFMLPKTSNGKLYRRGARQGFLESTLNSVFVWKESTVRQPANGGSRVRADAIIQWLRGYGDTRVNSFLMDERRSIPPYIVLDLGNHGVLGLQAPTEDGGSNLTNRDALRVLMQLAAIDTTLSSFVGVHNALGLRPILRYGTEAMRSLVLPQIASGRELAGFAFTEPGAGSNPRAITTTATPDSNGGWNLHGTKKWIGTAAWANYLVVFAHLLDHQGANCGITAFLVRQGMAGLRQGAEELTMGMRGMVQNTVHLEGVRVGPEDVLGEIGQGMIVAQDIMKFGRLCICAAGIGSMKRCVQLMVRYAAQRPISTGNLIDNIISRDRLTDLTQRITALDYLVDAFSGWLDEGLEVPEELYALAKIVGPESLGIAVDHLIQILGGRGYIETNIAPQLYRDARLLRIFEGPTETMLMFLGSRLASQSQPLTEFLRTYLRGSTVVTRLAEAAEIVKQRHVSGGNGADQPAKVQRMCQLLGDFGVWTLWLAAVECVAGSPDNSEAVSATAWLRREQARSFNRLKAPPEDYPEPLASADLFAIARKYVTDIGDIDQRCAGVEYSLDPLLHRAESVAASPPESGPARVAEANRVKPSDNKIDGNIQPRMVTPNEIENWLRAWVGRRLALPAIQIDPVRPFADFGVDSVTAVELADALAEWLQTPLPNTIAWDFPNIRAVATGVLQQTVNP